jgi:2,4-dienoyl-CoA reductase-like NADH-dependent reductase (Old Yellow Enzyme family)
MEARVEIQKDYIDKVIGAEIAKALGQSESIIQKVVEAAMNQKKDSYSSDTYFMVEVKEAIRQAAKESFQEWLILNKDEVKKALKKYLSTKEGLIDKLVKQIMTSMIDHVFVSIQIKE